MDEKLEEIFINFAETHEESLKEMGLTKDSFKQQAQQWCKTEEGKLEIQKFILENEISSLEKEIVKLNDSISRKKESISEIEDELSKL